MTTPDVELTALTDPENVLFEFVDDELTEGMTVNEAYEFLTGAGGEVGEVIVAAANEGHTGAMIALVPSREDVERLALDGFEAPEQLHLTLAYLGEAADIPTQRRGEVIRTARRYFTDEVNTDAFSVNVFNPHTDEVETAVVLGIRGEDIVDARSSLFSSLNGFMTVPPNHSPWVPHVTLAYTDDRGAVAEAVKRTGPIKFNVLRVAFADEVNDFPLGSPNDEELTDDVSVGVDVPTDEEITVAAGGDLMQVLANDRGLRRYWTKGPGAIKIRWGTDGSFARCVRHLGKYVRDPQGLCAEYHKEATGEWPAEKGIESAMEPLVAHGTHNQKTHGNSVSGRGSIPRVPSGGRSSGGGKSSGSGPNGDGGDTWSGASKKEIKEHVNRLKDKASKPDARAKIRATINLADRNELGDIADELGMKDVEGSTRQIADQIADFIVKKHGKSLTASAEPANKPWNGILSVEGVESGDGRMFALGSLDWAQLPLPLMYQPSSVGGHNASIMVGEITQVARRGNEIFGWGGVFGESLAGAHGPGIRQMMKTGGVSVDVDKVKDADVEYVYPTADEATAELQPLGAFAKPEMTIFHRGRVRGATLVAFPAFVEARLTFDDETLTASAGCDCDDDEPLVAAGHTITIPDLPKATWFDRPADVKQYGALTITDEGRVYGRLAPRGVTHRSVNRQVPMRTVDYSRWMNKETIVEGGGRVVTGVITMNCGHAATENYGTLAARKEHYDNSCSIFANVRIGEDADGVWIAGALRHGVSSDQVAAALGCTLSGDWQPHPDRPGITEFIAGLLVPVPGFAAARSRPSVEFNDGVVVSSTVPVRFAGTNDAFDEATQLAWRAAERTKQLIVASMGEDPKTRKMSILAELG